MELLRSAILIVFINAVFTQPFGHPGRSPGAKISESSESSESESSESSESSSLEILPGKTTPRPTVPTTVNQSTAAMSSSTPQVTQMSTKGPIVNSTTTSPGNITACVTEDITPQPATPAPATPPPATPPPLTTVSVTERRGDNVL